MFLCVVAFQLHSLAIWGKFLTGPWMTICYGNEKSLGHFDMIPLIRGCIERIRAVQDEPGMAVMI